MRDNKLTMRYFDNASKVALSYNDISSKTYNTGNLLIDYIALDFDKILNKIELIENSFISIKGTNENTVAESCLIIENLLYELIDIHPFNRDYLDIFYEYIGDYLEDISNSLNDRMNLLSMFINELGQHIYYDKITSNNYFEAISKCYSTDVPASYSSAPIQMDRNLQLPLLEMNSSKINVTFYPETTVTDSLKIPNISYREIFFDIGINTACFLEFMKLTSSKTIVKECNVCNRFFIPEGRKDKKSCNRIIDGTDKRCIDVGAKKLYRENKQDSPIDMLFDKVYTRNSKRRNRKKLTQEEFVKWSDKVREIRDAAKYNKISSEDYEKILNYQPEEIREWIKGE